MEPSTSPDRRQIVGALLVAGVALVGQGMYPYATPGQSVRSLFGSRSPGDSSRIERAGTREFYSDLVQRFGENKYRRAKEIFERATELGTEDWDRQRQRAEALAIDEYRALRLRVPELGRRAFAALGVEERMRLMDDAGKYEAFIYSAGVQALPERDRSRIPDPQAFRLQQDWRAFASTFGYQLLSEDDRSALGSAAALLPDSPQRAAYIDRVGMGRLRPEEREEIAGVQGAEVLDAQSFRAKHGKEGADGLARMLPTTVQILRCTFPREDSEGSLLKGTRAFCSVSAGGHPLGIELVKHGLDWRISDANPRLDSVSW